MKISIGNSCIFISIFLLAGFISTSARTSEENITIKVIGATIHEAPDENSPVMGNPAVGDIFDLVGISGDWYEIRIPSRLGMVKTGFINQRFLMEKPMAEPEKEPSQSPKHRFSLSADGGYGYGSTGKWNSDFNKGVRIGTTARVGMTDRLYAGFKFSRQSLGTDDDPTYYNYESDIEGQHIAYLDSRLICYDIFVGRIFPLSHSANKARFIYGEAGLGWTKTYSKVRFLIDNQYETSDWDEKLISDRIISYYLAGGVVMPFTNEFGISIGCDVRVVQSGEKTMNREDGILLGINAGIVILGWK